MSYNSAAVATYLYDTNNDLTAVAKPGSSTTKYAYTGTHQLEKITDPVQVAATGDAYIYNIYDSTAATRAVTKQYFGAEAGQGASGSASYNAMTYTSGRLDSTNRLNDDVDYILDGSDRIASKILGGFTTSYTYDSQGMVSTVTMPRGNLMSYTYDATTHTKKGNLLHAVHFDQVAGTGLSTSYTYTTLNLIDTITDPVDRYTDHDYDAQGNRVTTSYYDASTSGTLVGQEVFAYDTTNEGVLTKYTDANGNDTQYNYSTINSENAYRSAEIVLMAAGASDDITTSYAYDAYGNVTSKTDPLSHTTTMAYDAAQRMTQRASCSCGPKTKYHYNENSNLVSKETLYDTDGGESYLTTIHQYDDFALLTKVIQEDYDGSNDLSTVYTYDVVDRRASATDPLGNETTYTYDGRGLEITREIEGDSGTSADDITLLSAYDSNGNLTKSTDGRSLTTDYQYDKYDRRTKALDHDDHYSTTSYDASGMAITSSSFNSSDTLLAQTVSAYDARRRRTKSSVYAKTAGGSAIPTSGNYLETTYAYDDQGNLTSVVGAGGEETVYIYDKANRKVTMQEDLTSSTTVDTEYTYDKASRVTKTIYEENLSSARRVDVEYDDANRPTKRKYYAGTSTHSYSELMAYDVRNNVTLRQDDDLSTVVDRFHYLYDKLGRMTKKVGVLDDDSPDDFTDDQMVEYVYDVAGNVVTYKAYYGASNASSANTIYDYDKFSRLTTTTYPDSDTLTQTYDDAGNVITKIDPNASTIVYSYDGRNRRTQVDVTNGAAAAGVSKEAWAYDGLGRLTYAFNMIGANTICKINRAYTTHGKLDSERQQIYFDGTAGTDHTIAYLYDEDGDLETIEYPGHVASTNDDYVTYTRDYAGRITKVQKKDQGESIRTVAEYVFEGMQRVITKKHYPDEATQAFSLYEYDGLHRVTGITHQFDTSPVTKIAVYEYGYDHRNRRKYEDRYFYDRDDNRITTLSDKDRGEYYEYDLLGRLTKVYRALADSWTYPLSGGEYNTLVTYDYDKVSNRTERVVATTTTTYAYDPGTNEMTAAAGISQTYDDNGNYHAANTITCCHYDYKNQLAENRYGTFPVKTRLYNYDPLGRRIQKYLPGASATTTRYLYAGNDLIAYADGGNADSIDKKLVYGSMREPAEYETSGGTRYAFHENAQGSIGALSDRDNAHQDEQLRYSEFGETSWVQIDGGGASSVGGTQVDSEIGFLNGIWNSESGSGARYSMGREYDPSIARFRQPTRPQVSSNHATLSFSAQYKINLNVEASRSPAERTLRSGCGEIPSNSAAEGLGDLLIWIVTKIPWDPTPTGDCPPVQPDADPHDIFCRDPRSELYAPGEQCYRQFLPATTFPRPALHCCYDSSGSLSEAAEPPHIDEIGPACGADDLDDCEDCVWGIPHLYWDTVPDTYEDYWDNWWS